MFTESQQRDIKWKEETLSVSFYKAESSKSKQTKRLGEYLGKNISKKMQNEHFDILKHLSKFMSDNWLIIIYE